MPMNSKSRAKAPIRLFKAGEQKWGALATEFVGAEAPVTIFIDHDGVTADPNWEAKLSEVETYWGALREHLERTLPGGLRASVLAGIDLRSHLSPSRAVLTFRTTQDRFDWFVRLSHAGTIEVAGPLD